MMPRASHYLNLPITAGRRGRRATAGRRGRRTTTGRRGRRTLLHYSVSTKILPHPFRTHVKLLSF